MQDVVSGNGRYSLDVASAFPDVAAGRFSVLVESVGSRLARSLRLAGDVGAIEGRLRIQRDF